MKPVQLSEDVYWVGAIDYNLSTFHGYLTQRGSTYNAYLIMDDTITLIDTVKHYKFNEMMERIAEVTDPSRIGCIVSNHVEMDHSGSLPQLMDIVPEAEIIASPNGEKGLKNHFPGEWEYTQAASGESRSIGSRTLTFVNMPMVHWPDSMATYCEEEKILFPNDAFGQHMACSARFDDEVPIGILLEEARKYYANIVLPYGKQVQKALGALSDIETKMIAPSHGIIWRSNIGTIVDEYRKWSQNITDEKCVIVYDTMWGSTEKLARAVSRGFEKRNIPVEMRHLQHYHISDIMTDVMESRYVCIGSPTLNNGILPTAASFLSYMKGLSPLKRTGLSFGSYGWGGQGTGIIEQGMKDCGWDLFETVRHQYVPDRETLDSISESVEKQLSGE